LSSHSNGKCSKISKGSASAAQTMNSEIPLFKVLVAEIHNTISILSIKNTDDNINLHLLLYVVVYSSLLVEPNLKFLWSSAGQPKDML
jgi:hypothetical protein